jgi:hypothetical protein
MDLDPDTKSAIVIGVIFGAIGGAAQRLFFYLTQINSLTQDQQIAFLSSQAIGFFVVLVIAAIVTMAAILGLPLNYQNKRQLAATSVAFGIVWPIVLDKLIQGTLSVLQPSAVTVGLG